MEFDLSLAFDSVVKRALGIEVNFTFKVIQEDLLLLSNGYACGTLYRLEIIQSNETISFSNRKLAEFSLEEVLGKYSVVFLLIKPRIVVPD
jgi:hypothetical protein